MKFLVLVDCEKKGRKPANPEFVRQPRATFGVLEIPGDKLPEGMEFQKVDRLDVDWDDAGGFVGLLQRHCDGAGIIEPK